jgi:hypothetical protein
MRVSRPTGVSREHFQAVPRHVERLSAPGLNLDNSYKDVHCNQPEAPAGRNENWQNLHFFSKAAHSNSIFWRHCKSPEITMTRSFSDLKKRIFYFLTQKRPVLRICFALFKIMPVDPAELRGTGMQISSQGPRNSVCSVNWITVCIGKRWAK